MDAHSILGLTDCTQLGAFIIHSRRNILPCLQVLGTYHITLHDNHQPVVNPQEEFHKDRLLQALERNVHSGVLKKVDQPTDWASNLVVLRKRMDLYDYAWILKIWTKICMY